MQDKRNLVILGLCAALLLVIFYALFDLKEPKETVYVMGNVDGKSVVVPLSQALAELQKNFANATNGLAQNDKAIYEDIQKIKQAAGIQ